GTDSADLPGFGAASSAAPNGTWAVVVANNSTAGGRIAGYVAINDATTSDGWIITDSLHQWGNASGPLVMPLVPIASNDIYITNTSSTPATISLEGHAELRKHVVGHGGGSPLQLTQVAPMSTAFVRLPAQSGYVRISAPANITATGRVTLSASGASFGSSLPGVPAGAAFGAGQGKRF